MSDKENECDSDAGATFAVVDSLRGDGGYFLAEALGDGAYGSIRTVYDEHGQMFAAKEFVDEDDDEEEEEDSDDSDDSDYVPRKDSIVVAGGANGMTLELGTAREISALRLISLCTGGKGHPNIMPVHDVSAVKGCEGMCMIMPKFSCSLEGAIKGGAFNVKGGNKMMMQVAHGLITAVGFLHANQIIHRDIKTANVLLDDDMRAVLADFSLAKLWDPHATMNGVTHTPGLGTPTYRAPEVYSEEDYDFSSDIYSTGVVLLELFNGLFTVDRDKAAMAQVEAMRAKLNDKPIPAMIKAMIDPLPSKRPTAAQLLKMDCFKKFPVSELKLCHDKLLTMRPRLEDDEKMGGKKKGKKGKGKGKGGPKKSKYGDEYTNTYKHLELENPLTMKAARVYAERSKERPMHCVVLAAKLYEEDLPNMVSVLGDLPKDAGFDVDAYRSAEMRIFKAMDFCLYV